MRYSVHAALACTLAIGACSREAAVPMPHIPQTDAKVMAKAVLDTLQQGNPTGFWAAMPERWRDDVNSLVREFAGKMDAELYDETTNLLRRMVTVMRNKKHFIFNSSVMPMAVGPQRAELERNWDGVMDFFDVILESDVGNIRGLRRFDGGRFLSTTGPRFLTSFENLAAAQGYDLMTRLGEVGVESVKKDSTAQVLRFTAPGEEPQELRFVEVDGHWVPELMARKWDTDVADLRRQVGQMPDTNDAQTQMQFKLFLGMFGGVIERLEKVESQEEFDQVFKGMSGMMGRPPR